LYRIYNISCHTNLFKNVVLTFCTDLIFLKSELLLPVTQLQVKFLTTNNNYSYTFCSLKYVCFYMQTFLVIILALNECHSSQCQQTWSRIVNYSHVCDTKQHWSHIITPETIEKDYSHDYIETKNSVLIKNSGWTQGKIFLL